MESNKRLTDPFYYPGNRVGCLLIHGFTGAPSEVMFLGERLAGAGYTVLGLRLSGHGTTPEEMAKTRWEDWIQDVRRGIVQLRSTCDFVVAVGFSMGGLLALAVGEEGLVDGIASLNAPMQLANARTRYAWFYRAFLPFVKKPTLTEAPDQAMLPGSGRFVYTTVPSASLHSLNQAMKKVRRALHKIQCPVLLMQSRRDETVKPESVEIIRQGITGQTPELIYWPKSGHMLTMGVEREQVALKVDAFIRSISGITRERMG